MEKRDGRGISHLIAFIVIHHYCEIPKPRLLLNLEEETDCLCNDKHKNKKFFFVIIQFVNFFSTLEFGEALRKGKNYH